jgi:hypothetical protein
MGKKSPSVGLIFTAGPGWGRLTGKFDETRAPQ